MNNKYIHKIGLGKGYDGLFAPKPNSTCLKVSENSDGCAIFFKRNKFSIISAEVIITIIILIN